MDVEPGLADANAEEVDTVSTHAAGETSNAATFCLPDGIDRISQVTGRSHFDHNPGVVVDRNQIDLPVGDPKVGTDDTEAVVCQEPDGQPLTKLPKFSTRVV
ncbi:MAG: hypothetical protein O7B77_02110 [Actinobacteria bacterium]|nr:hypothetical protein [Actinomycetota bacterium]